MKYAGQTTDLRTIGKELGARYVMEGSLRQAGAKLQYAVQLVDAQTGAQLWAETYERTFDAAAIFEIQDDLVPRIVATVADQNGVLPHSMSAIVRTKKAGQLTFMKPCSAPSAILSGSLRTNTPKSGRF